MAAIQKINHLKVHTLSIKGTEFAPIERPDYPSEKATVAELTEAFVDLIARLTEAGVFIVPENDADAAE